MCTNCERNDVAILAVRSFYRYVNNAFMLVENEEDVGDIYPAWERMQTWAAQSKGRELDEEAAAVEVSVFARSVEDAYRTDQTDNLEKAARCLLSAMRMKTWTFGDDADYDRALANAHPDVLKKFITELRRGRPFSTAARLRASDERYEKG